MMKNVRGEILPKCKWSKWQVIDDLWNHEFVCTYGCGHYCFADEECKHYWPDGKDLECTQEKN